MRCGERILGIRSPGRMHAERVAEPRGDPRLVVGDPARDAVTEPRGDDLGVLDESLGGGSLGPAARVLEHLGKIPVVQRRKGLDVVRKQLVDEPVVEIEAGLVDASPAFWEHPRPRDREAESIETEVGHQGDVLWIAVVEVARDRAGVTVPHLSRGVAEAIPDALAAAVLVRGAFDLVRRGRRAPEKVDSGSDSPWVLLRSWVV